MPTQPKKQIVYVQPQKGIIEQIDRPVTLILIICGVLAGLFIKGYNLAGNVVSQDQFTRAITEIKSSIEGFKSYADVRASETLDKAEKYSDANRLQTRNDMQTTAATFQDSQAKLQSKVDSMAVKLDLMFEAQQRTQKGR